MTQAKKKSTLSRRGLVNAGLAIGAAGLAWTSLKEARAAAPKFQGVKPLRPAPAIAKSVLPAPPLAAIVFNKAAFGPRPGDVDAFNALGPDDNTRLTSWVNTQLNPTGTDTELNNRLTPHLGAGGAYDTINKTRTQLWAQHARDDDWQTRNRPIWQMERLTLLRAAYSQWQVREVVSDFWMNHFNVYGREFPTQGMMPFYESSIRAHLFGNFGDMLNDVAKTSSMLYYLDNYTNSWPYPNENYAREVLELHTLGAIENYYGAVDPGSVPNNSQGQRAGYTEIDVFEFARALTGWGVADDSHGAPDTGEFLFRAGRHYDFTDGAIDVMDVSIPSTLGEGDVTTILDYLAGHYGTARYIAWKLCTRLISDDPPESIVSSTADQFYNRRADADQLKEVYRHILLSTEFQTTWGEKIKRPVETVVRAFRAIDADLTIRLDDSDSNDIVNRLRDTGHYPFGFEPPTGFPDERALWQGSGPLVMSWRSITRMLTRSNIVNVAVQTNTGIPVAANRTATGLVNFWMNRALGYNLPASVVTRLETFITDISGTAANAPLDPSVDTSNTSNSSTYQRIIRGLVGLILMSPDAMRR